MERAAIFVAVMMTLAMPGAAPAAEAASVQELYRLSYATEARGDPAGALHFMDEAVKQGETGYVLHLRRGWLLHLARRHALDRARNRPDMGRRGAAATADDIEKAAAREFHQLA